MRTGLRRVTRRLGEVLVGFGAPERQLVLLDYRVDPQPRGQHAEIRAMLDTGEVGYRTALMTLADVLPRLDDSLPWENRFLSPFDAVTLYGLISTMKPQRYVEIGSGNSTVYARRAIVDHSRGTKLISIDPNPREDIDRLCDELVRMRLEDIDPTFFCDLEKDDIVFFDGSHCAFPNSDVTVFFLDVFPNLAPGVAVGIHDIYLPDDYPPDATSRMWSEQYLLATQLLAEGVDRVLLPNFYVTHYTDIATEALRDPWDRLSLTDYHGCAFWMLT